MRLFIAIELENEIKDYLAKTAGLISTYCKKGNFTRRDNFHITMHFIGNADMDDVELLKEAVFKTAQGIKAFELKLSGFGAFNRGDTSLLWFGLEKSNELIRTFNSLERNLLSEGFPKEKKGLSPHITMAREAYLYTSYEKIKSDILLEEKKISVTKLSLMESSRKKGVLTYTPIFTSKFK